MNPLFAENRAHAYLFTGNEAALVALDAARTLLCETRSACGHCRACRMFQEGSHPDYALLTDEKSIKVEDVRDAIRLVNSISHHGTRVVHIRGGMTAQAQNALLKTLEEPPAGTVFLLEGEFLPTVVSRCVPVRQNASQQQLAQRLIEQGIDAPLAALASGVSETLEQALAFVDPAAQQRRREAFVAAERLYANPRAALEYYRSQSDLRGVFELQASFFADAAALGKDAAAPLRNADARARIEKCGDPARALRLFSLLTESIERLNRNANARLTASRLVVLAERATGTGAPSLRRAPKT